MEQLRKLDSLGTIISIGGMICLLLAVQYGAASCLWNDGRIISLFVVLGVTMPIFIWIQHGVGDDALMALRIISCMASKPTLGTQQCKYWGQVQAIWVAS